MSNFNPEPGGFGQPDQQPAPGYGYPQQPAPGYGHPQSAPGYPAAPPMGYPQAPGYAMPMQPSNGMGTTGLVLGIIGVVCSLTIAMEILGMILGILAIIFGAIGRGKANRGEATNKGAATAGLVCGIIATVLLPVLVFLVFASVFSAGSTF
ncbi:uncharacterized protein DUF4190 [Streptomyces puniciscabiei]|uniref:Uncharacterized protein DUF4190 n=1 Tax=Streptomyces puniciscabiei TaxID=164348 RepID=A0A542UAT6_9ACTN|nr:DUF4190 domain-containing protein [Streptomyces puniciscabiei]TQK96199.1 uncharacterized protein DUF4190 [Streptomyces puniciscabiei]